MLGFSSVFKRALLLLRSDRAVYRGVNSTADLLVFLQHKDIRTIYVRKLS